MEMFHSDKTKSSQKNVYYISIIKIQQLKFHQSFSCLKTLIQNKNEGRNDETEVYVHVYK